VGPNGAGKTTLLRLIAGVTTPTVGELHWRGRPVRWFAPAFRDHVGYMPQSFGFYPELTGREFLAYMARLKAVPEPVPEPLLENRISELAVLVGLEPDFLELRPSSYSVGQRKRLALAQALLNDPELLVLDEPTSGLDYGGRGRLAALLEVGAQSRTVVVSTHQLDELGLCDRVLVLREGRPRYLGPTARFRLSAEGKVWDLEQSLMDRVPNQCIVVNTRYIGSRTQLRRVLSHHKPTPGARQVDPDWEAAYLFHTQSSLLT